MTQVSKVIFYWITVFADALSVLVNARTLLCFFAIAKTHSRQYGMLLLTMVVHLFYNFGSAAYSGYMIAIIRGRLSS
ncbi:hypothetical protein L596_026760 [Steinernema carpocapsae]|uniref:Uncharacterized protein n=1 Tax=Steinernema carpocapsae TaxID=34508 RepID=A0A4U5M2A7_STECR|nr:hypothetical protein L596_026760 [Steinernema carpocapsae]